MNTVVKKPKKPLDLAQAFRQRLVDTVSISNPLRSRINIQSTTWNDNSFSLVFRFYPQVSNGDSALSAHSSLLFWISHLLQALMLKTNRLPRYLTDQVYAHDHFVWEVPSKGFILLEPSGPISLHGTRPNWTMSFMTADHDRMAWRSSQLRHVASTLSMLNSFEFDRVSGSVARQPSETDFRTAMADLRSALRGAALLT